MSEEIKLLTAKDIVELCNWNKDTVNRLMNEPNFPVIKIGKENQVEYDAFKQYLSERRDLRGKWSKE